MMLPYLVSVKSSLRPILTQTSSRLVTLLSNMDKTRHIANAVHTVARHNAHPTLEAVHVCSRILSYISVTESLGLTFILVIENNLHL